MSDRLRCSHPAPPGLPHADALTARPSAVVVGAGIAGLAAATAMAERGVAVAVIERETYLGGRAGGWTERHDGFQVSMNRGFHAFFRQYYNLRALLRRIDPDLRMLTPVDDYPLVDGEGRRDTFRGLPHTPPWNALLFALRSPTFRLRDLASLNAAAAAPLAAVSVPEIYARLDRIDAEEFLQGINFPQAARHLAFEVFSRSFFADPSQLSAAELATMFHIYFLGSSEGLVFDVPTANYDTALWGPLRKYLEARAVDIQLGTRAVRIDTDAARPFRVHTDFDEYFDADAVVLATDVAGLQQIVAESGSLGDNLWCENVRRLRTAPPFEVRRLWLDRPVMASRPAFLGTAGHKPLDNISVLERYEHEAGEWARNRGGSVIELHCYALGESPNSTAAIQEMHALYPETAGAKTLIERRLHRSDCPLFAPGSHFHRPGIVTPRPGLVLAGDAIRIDLPVALMERAATTGFTAANHLLAKWGLAGHALNTVPVRGRSGLLRWFASRQERASA